MFVSVDKLEMSNPIAYSVPVTRPRVTTKHRSALNEQPPEGRWLSQNIRIWKRSAFSRLPGEDREPAIIIPGCRPSPAWQTWILLWDH